MKLLAFTVNFERKGYLEKISIFIHQDQDITALRSAINHWLPSAIDCSEKALVTHLDGIGMKAFLNAEGNEGILYENAWKKYSDGVEIEMIVNEILDYKNLLCEKKNIISDFCKDFNNSKKIISQMKLIKDNFDIFLDYIENHS